MNYKITEQYSKTEEILMAEFSALNDARIFITQKLSSDDVKRMYRLYNDDLMIEEFNRGNISVAYARYADGNADIHADGFSFNVTLQMDGNTDRMSVAKFNHIDDATSFIIRKCDVDKTIHNDDLFIIFKGQYVVDRLNKASIANRKKESDAMGQHNTGLTFHPSPLQIVLKPLGFPKDYRIPEDDDD